ncbi:MAG: PmoA family protein [Candidatus Hydrogenedentes bacterium]|nr:PmoA family protein [Candidatus Hydrogenedentota bacterium]
MPRKTMSRRQAIQLSVSAGIAVAAGARRSWAVDYTEPVPEAEDLTAYLRDAQVQVRWNNMPLTVYRAHPSQKYPYFYPLNGLASGTSLTTESALPYPHHRGLWLGCDPVNGGNYWADDGLKSGHIESTALEVGNASGRSAEILNRCRWVREGAPSPFSDEREFTVAILNDRVWVIDAKIKLHANEDVEIAKAKHSLFAIRAASDISCPYGGTLMNSEGGEGAKGTYGKEATWCGFHGERAGRPGVVEGIAVMTHPDNPWKPIWFTRDYGHLSPSPFNFLDAPWRLGNGESIELKYRVALHVGTPKEADLDGVYRLWLEPAT